MRFHLLLFLYCSLTSIVIVTHTALPDLMYEQALVNTILDIELFDQQVTSLDIHRLGTTLVCDSIHFIKEALSIYVIDYFTAPHWDFYNKSHILGLVFNIASVYIFNSYSTSYKFTSMTMLI